MIFRSREGNDRVIKEQFPLLFRDYALRFCSSTGLMDSRSHLFCFYSQLSLYLNDS